MISQSNNSIRVMLLFTNRNIFRHLKLEIALAIPLSNDVKYNRNDLFGQGA